MRLAINSTIRDLYRPAMEIVDLNEAKEYFEALVKRQMKFGKDRKEAEEIERGNIGYYAGYYDMETMERVKKLFFASHPVFG